MIVLHGMPPGSLQRHAVHNRKIINRLPTGSGDWLTLVAKLPTPQRPIRQS